MEQILRIVLPIYFIIYFGIAFVAKTIMVAKRIGKNPLVLPKDDSAYGLIGFYFKSTILCIFIYLMVYAFLPNSTSCFLPIVYLQKSILQYLGLCLLAFAMLWTIIAQAQMKDSWRIGIDTETKTALVSNGLFSISRNPIFFGMLLSQLGLFLATANAVTGLFFVVSYLLIQIQVRLEEEFLTKEHGEIYLGYTAKVRRMI